MLSWKERKYFFAAKLWFKAKERKENGTVTLNLRELQWDVSIRFIRPHRSRSWGTYYETKYEYASARLLTFGRCCQDSWWQCQFPWPYPPTSKSPRSLWNEIHLHFAKTTWKLPCYLWLAYPHRTNPCSTHCLHVSIISWTDATGYGINIRSFWKSGKACNAGHKMNRMPTAKQSRCVSNVFPGS